MTTSESPTTPPGDPAQAAPLATKVRARLRGDTFEVPDGRHAPTDTETADEVHRSWDAHHAQVVAARKSEHLLPVLADDARVGICCSGGGIRSAAFNLGALQALQRVGRLHTTDYLAAVSGGAYIAGAMSILQMPTVDSDGTAAGTDRDDVGFDAVPPYALGSPEERHLRNNSSYLAPSARDRLRLLGYLLVGATMQVLAVVALLALLALPMAVVGVLLVSQLRPGDDLAPWAAARGPTTTLGLMLLSAGVLVALWSIGRRGADERGAPQRRLAWALGLAGAVILLVVAVLPWLVSTALRIADALSAANGDDALTRLLVALTAAGVPTVIVSAIRLVGAQLKGGIDPTASPRWRLPEWSSWAAYVVAPLVIATLFLLLYLWGVRMGPVGGVRALVVCALVLAGFYALIDPNMSSMHTFYRERLGKAFAVQRVRAPGRPAEAVVRPYNVPTTLSRTRDALGDRMWPQLLICAAVNVSVPGRTPTGRDALPLVFSHDWIGGDEIGWVKTTAFEGALRPQAQDSVGRSRADTRGQSWLATLLASIAVSGAALSPSMGKMTSRPYRFLLGLANARLGVWLPNLRLTGGPGSLNRRPWLSWQLRELVGTIDTDSHFLYVSDGGHYENLGLVELLRRRCTQIWCFDASGDPPDSFTTLAQALAMARTDLPDVEITDLRPSTLRQGSARTPPPTDRVLADSSVLVTDFCYREHDGSATRAKLIYVKCRVTADAPWDVTALYERDLQFPNHSTADQLYGEERFEAYRKLGDHLATRAFARFRESMEAATPDPCAPDATAPVPATQVTVPAAPADGAANGAASEAAPQDTPPAARSTSAAGEPTPITEATPTAPAAKTAPDAP
jgi:hypothetical protein